MGGLPDTGTGRLQLFFEREMKTLQKDLLKTKVRLLESKFREENLIKDNNTYVSKLHSVELKLD
jgi:hypothetical protein